MIESPPRAFSRVDIPSPGLLAASALELIPRQPTADRPDAADPRRRSRSPSRPEARALTSTENTPPRPRATDPAANDLAPNDVVALEHAETGAPAPEELESQVEELGGAPVAPDSPLFSDFDVHPDIVAALTDAGITRTFAIQELTLPLALAGHDLIGQARTGTGKTLGFGVPMLQRVVPPGGGWRRRSAGAGRRPHP